MAGRVCWMAVLSAVEDVDDVVDRQLDLVATADADGVVSPGDSDGVDDLAVTEDESDAVDEAVEGYQSAGFGGSAADLEVAVLEP